MFALKSRRSLRGRPALNALRRSPRVRLLRGTGGIRAVLIAGRPIRSIWVPAVVVVVAQTPMTALLGPILLLGISRMRAMVLTFGPKKLWACPGARGNPAP